MVGRDDGTSPGSKPRPDAWRAKDACAMLGISPSHLYKLAGPADSLHRTGAVDQPAGHRISPVSCGRVNRMGEPLQGFRITIATDVQSNS